MNIRRCFIKALKNSFGVKNILIKKNVKDANYVYCDIDEKFSLVFRSGFKDSFSILNVFYKHCKLPNHFISFDDLFIGEATALLDWHYNVEHLIENAFKDFIVKVQKSNIQNKTDAILSAYVYLENYYNKEAKKGGIYKIIERFS